MGGTVGSGVVVKENWPFGDLVVGDYEPCSRWVRSWFGEGLD